MRRTILTICLLLIASIISLTTQAQKTENYDDSPYSILMETKGDTITLSCKSGCQWGKVQLVLKKNKIITVTHKEVGKEKLSLNTQIKITQPFSFYLKRTEDGFMMQGKEGTRWANVGFTCEHDCSVFIDRYGLIDYY